MSGWLVFFLLISCHCVTCFKAESPCRGFHGATSNVCRVMGENIRLTCSVPRNCNRGYWKYDDNINEMMWLLPEQRSSDTYLFSFNSSQGVNTLHIYNINSSVAGLYSCSCDDRKGERTIYACFNLSVLQSPISKQMHGETRVFRMFEQCSVRGAVEMVDVKVNEKITIKCDDQETRETNCSQLEEYFSFTVKSSHHLCSFSCRPKIESMEREVTIILNVIDNTISTTTATPSTTIPTETTPEIITDSTVIYSPPSTDHSISTERKPSTITQNKPVTSLTSKSTIKTTCQTVTAKKTTHMGNGSSPMDTLLPTTANVNHGNSSLTEDSPTDNSFLQRPVRVIVAFCVIFVLVVIILLLCVHITFYKKGIRSCKDKEEWVNPIYESADNGTQFPIAIPDEGNPYDTVNSPRQVADSSCAVSTTNNVHQINADLSSTNDIPMVHVGNSQDIAVKRLDYTITASNVGSMELNKPSCKKIEKSPAATEALSLPKADEISTPPASPHLYEILNDEVRSQ